MKIKSIKSVKNLKNKTILVRCDFDLPISEKTRTTTRKNAKIKILDNSRLLACVPTIEFLLKKKVKQIILIGHLGRPAGKIVAGLSLEPVKKEMEKLLGKKIEFIKFDEIIKPGLKAFKPGLIELGLGHKNMVILENLRFNSVEQKNDKKFAKELSNLADIYVNEAFAVSHRSASSVDAIQNYLPSYAGLNLEQEILNLSAVLKNPKKPLTIIIGGAKIETKLPVINNFVKSADNILIGGGVANTFLKAQGMDIKNSLVDNNYLKQAKKLLKNNKILLPIDVYFLNKKNKELARRSNNWELRSEGWEARIYDIGSKTIREYSAIIKTSQTILWNGPMGYFEDKKFRSGTEKIAQAILKNKKAKVIIGGGETLEAIKNSKFQIPNSRFFLSTGGGAMLEFLSGKKLPGLRKIIND